VIGGYVYRGNALPSLRGRYVYGDFVTGQVWALGWNGTTVTSNEPIEQAPNPTSFGEDNDGELYLVTRGSGVFVLEETSGGGSVPDLLSETGLFADLTNLMPAAGLVDSPAVDCSPPRSTRRSRSDRSQNSTTSTSVPASTAVTSAAISR
jgi:hypothetical protein